MTKTEARKFFECYIFGFPLEASSERATTQQELTNDADLLAIAGYLLGHVGTAFYDEFEAIAENRGWK